MKEDGPATSGPRPTAPHTELGRLGEEYAARWFLARGWTLVARNHREGRREIDLVVARGAVLAFVEVKARRGTAFGHPFDAITGRKRLEVRRAARGWLASPEGDAWLAGQRRRIGGRVRIRFDAFSVLFGPRAEPVLEHLPDAWGF